MYIKLYMHVWLFSAVDVVSRVVATTSLYELPCLVLEHAGLSKVPKFKHLDTCSLLLKWLPYAKSFYPTITFFN